MLFRSRCEMKPYAQRKVTIIGLGFLMEYIFPCFRQSMGNAAIEQVNGVTADAGDLEDKKKRMGISVWLNDSMAALKEMQPDMIFFAPPPSVAREICATVLVPYFAAQRAENKAVPQLIAFPPNPPGVWYQEMLGDDIQVVNIIPNMKSKVGEEDVSAEACHLVTYPAADCWPQEEKDALESFFLPMGRSIHVPPALILQVLSGEIGVHSLTEVADIAARVLNEQGIACHYRDTASVMRARHQQRQQYTAPGSNRCNGSDVGGEEAQKKLRDVVDAWYDALHRYLVAQGFGEKDSRELLNPLVDLSLHEAQVETREQIVAKAHKDATKGGMRELAMQTYSAVTESLLAKFFAASQEEQGMLLEELSRQIEETCHAVVERGKGLADAAASHFTPKEHAVMFALLARNILRVFGEKQGDELLLKAVAKNGMQRGSRMAQRARMYGKPLDMASYQAFGEWRYSGGFAKEGLFETPYSAYRVLSCPWRIAWEESELAQYAPYYCRVMDQSILQGFSSDLALEMPVYYHPEKSPYCEFHWKDFVPGKEHDAKKEAILAEIQDRCVKDFVYHTAHIYATLVDCAKQEDAQKGAEVALCARKDFEKKCSYQAWLKVLALLEEDFDHV